MLYPVPRAGLVLDLLQDHHFLAVVDRPVHPDLADTAALEPVDAVVDLGHQGRHVVDRRHDADDGAADVFLRGRPAEVDLLDHLAAEDGRDVLDPGDVEPFEDGRRPQYLTHRHGVAQADRDQHASRLPDRPVENDVMRADRIEAGFVFLEPTPHSIDVVDPEIARKNERVEAILTHCFPPVRAPGRRVSAV
jgi:hypothetical protein